MRIETEYVIFESDKEYDGQVVESLINQLCIKDRNIRRRKHVYDLEIMEKRYAYDRALTLAGQRK